MKPTKRKWAVGTPTSFTLVEVVLALGVASFCLITVMSLVSVGLIGFKSSSEQAAGGLVLKQIATDIRGASTNSSGAYIGLGLCTNLVWTLGGSSIDYTYTNLSLGGSQRRAQEVNDWLPMSTFLLRQVYRPLAMRRFP